MIVPYRADERHADAPRQQAAWRTTCPRIRAGESNGDGPTERLEEYHVPPGAPVPHRGWRAETVSFVREGVVAFEDSTGRSSVIGAGEFQCTRADATLRRRERNASLESWAQLFHVRLGTASAGEQAPLQQRRFSAAQRRGLLCVVASRDARGDSLRLRQDALVLSALLDPGQHVAHSLAPGRRAWLHVVAGTVVVGDVRLSTGEGAVVEAELAVSLTAGAAAEILLLDLVAARAL